MLCAQHKHGVKRLDDTYKCSFLFNINYKHLILICKEWGDTRKLQHAVRWEVQQFLLPTRTNFSNFFTCTKNPTQHSRRLTIWILTDRIVLTSHCTKPGSCKTLVIATSHHHQSDDHLQWLWQKQMEKQSFSNLVISFTFSTSRLDTLRRTEEFSYN